MLLQHLDSYVQDTEDTKFNKPRVLGKNLEKYINIDLTELVIKDSFNFLPSSLDKLADNLKSKTNAQSNSEDTLPQVFPNLYKYFCSKFPNHPETDFELLAQKGKYRKFVLNNFYKNLFLLYF